LSRNDDGNDRTDKTRRNSKKKEEEGSSRRRYDNNNDDYDKDMDGRGREGEGEGEEWWTDHCHTRHGQHLRLPPGNDDGGYDDKDVPVIPASDLGEAAEHFLAVAVLLPAFLLSSSSSSRAAAAAAG
jgi:hypothetical protein